LSGASSQTTGAPGSSAASASTTAGRSSTSTTTASAAALAAARVSATTSATGVPTACTTSCASARRGAAVIGRPSGRLKAGASAIGCTPAAARSAPRPDRDHARHRARRLAVDAGDAAMGDGRAHEGGEQLPGRVDVVGETALAAQQCRVLDAAHRAAAAEAAADSADVTGARGPGDGAHVAPPAIVAAACCTARTMLT
jgi:hypothetical protein